MIIVTGASDGLGYQVAKTLHAKGKKVIGLSRTKSDLPIETVITDLTKPDVLKESVKSLSKNADKLEALINCAGVLSVEKIHELSVGEVERVFSTNVTGPMLLTSLLMEKIKKDGADIVNVASTVGTKAYENQASYGASKWAMRGFSANLQLELKKYPCRVISFCPGGFKTKLFQKATGVDNTSNSDSWMRAEDLANFIVQILDLPKNMEVSEVIISRK